MGVALGDPGAPLAAGSGARMLALELPTPQKIEGQFLEKQLRSAKPEPVQLTSPS